MLYLMLTFLGALIVRDVVSQSQGNYNSFANQNWSPIISPCLETRAITRAHAGTHAKCFTRAKNRACQWCYTI